MKGQDIGGLVFIGIIILLAVVENTDFTDYEGICLKEIAEDWCEDYNYTLRYVAGDTFDCFEHNVLHDRQAWNKEKTAWVYFTDEEISKCEEEIQ